MSFFDLFKKKKKEQPIEELQWNKMWDLLLEDKLKSPYAELMNYYGQVGDDGHFKFFNLLSLTEELDAAVSALCGILEGALKQNLKRAYGAYHEEEDLDKLEKILSECDKVFRENYGEIEKTLREYAKTVII